MRWLVWSCLVLYAAEFLLCHCWTSVQPASSKRTLKVYVAELPETFDVFNRPYIHTSNQTLGSLDCMFAAGCTDGPLLDSNLSFWADDGRKADRWFVSQLLRSPLRVGTAEEADVVFVPTILMENNTNHQNDIYQELFANPRHYFPFLGRLPHFLVLPTPRLVHRNNNDSLVVSPAAKHFIILTTTSGDYEHLARAAPANFVNIPYVFQIHWDPFTLQQKRKEHAQELLLHKPHWLYNSFMLRLVLPRSSYSEHLLHNRYLLYAHCLATKDNKCRYRCPAGEKSSDVDIQREWQEAVFVGMPVGDWMSRNSFGNSLAAGSIPVVPFDGYSEFMPFTDVLDWRTYTEVMPDLTEARCGCTHPTYGPLRTDMFVHRGAETTNFAWSLPNIARDSFTSCQCNGPTIADYLDTKYANNKTALLQKLQAVIDVRQVFQYSFQPIHTVVTWDDVASLDPRDDAFTFSLKAMMRKACELRKTDKCPEHNTVHMRHK